METLFERLLNFYQIDENTYYELVSPIDEFSFAKGHEFNDMDKAIDLVKKVMKNHGKIFIYGDYDADGVMATSILVKAFKTLSYEVSYYLPSRYIDGYGLTLNKAKWAKENNFSLVITVDNGISAFEAISYLKDNNIDVLVLDHHEKQESLPNANYILHPIYSNFGDIPSCGGFVSFIFASNLLGYFDKYLSTLASISLIGDMMPLKGYNRDLMRIAIKNYIDCPYKVIDLLKENDPFKENTIGMKIASKINAIGRIVEDDSINQLVDLFTCDDDDKILYYINWINETNELRKSMTKNAFDNLDIKELNKAAIVIKTNEKEGIIGLLSNKIASTYHLPCIVFSTNNNGELKGSARAPKGFNVVDAFTSLSDLMLTYGGHALAGGCSIKEEDFLTFKKRFTEYAENHPCLSQEDNLVPIYLREITHENYELISSFSPFGESWPSPLFSLSRIRPSALSYSKTGEHIMSYISSNTRLVGFNISRASLKEYLYVDFIGKLKESSFKGKINLDFMIDEVKQSYK